MEALNGGHDDRAVLVVADQFSLGFGGVPESILLLARALAARAVQIDVLSKDGLAADVGCLTDLPSAGRRLSLADMRKIDVTRYRAILLAGSWNPIAWWIALAAKRKGVRLIYTPKGNLSFVEFSRLRDFKKFPYLATVELSLLAMSDRIVYSSQLERDHSYLSSIFSDKAVVIPETFAGLPVGEKRPRSDGPIRFGFMAEIAPRKGLADLVSAFVAWQREGALDVELHIAGQPRRGSERYYEKARKIADAAPRPDRIAWMGALRGQARDDFYEQIDFFVHPTRFESFGLTPLEALWRGTPIMVTRNLGVLEFLSKPDSMVSLGRGSPDEILSGLRLALNERDAYFAAANRWRCRVCPQLAGDKLASAFLQAFDI